MKRNTTTVAYLHFIFVCVSALRSEGCQCKTVLKFVILQKIMEALDTLITRAWLHYVSILGSFLKDSL